MYLYLLRGHLQHSQLVQSEDRVPQPASASSGSGRTRTLLAMPYFQALLSNLQVRRILYASLGFSYFDHPLDVVLVLLTTKLTFRWRLLFIYTHSFLGCSYVLSFRYFLISMAFFCFHFIHFSGAMNFPLHACVISALRVGVACRGAWAVEIGKVLHINWANVCIYIFTLKSDLIGPLCRSSGCNLSNDRAPETENWLNI